MRAIQTRRLVVRSVVIALVCVALAETAQARIGPARPAAKPAPPNATCLRLRRCLYAGYLSRNHYYEINHSIAPTDPLDPEATWDQGGWRTSFHVPPFWLCRRGGAVFICGAPEVDGVVLDGEISATGYTKRLYMGPSPYGAGGYGPCYVTADQSLSADNVRGLLTVETAGPNKSLLMFGPSAEFGPIPNVQVRTSGTTCPDPSGASPPIVVAPTTTSKPFGGGILYAPDPMFRFPFGSSFAIFFVPNPLQETSSPTFRLPPDGTTFTETTTTNAEYSLVLELWVCRDQKAHGSCAKPPLRRIVRRR